MEQDEYFKLTARTRPIAEAANYYDGADAPLAAPPLSLLTDYRGHWERSGSRQSFGVLHSSCVQWKSGLDTGVAGGIMF
jgi:hypothetical protein